MTLHELYQHYRHLTDPQSLAAFGPALYAILGTIVFAETGLLVGFFLPGDSLLFAAGVVAATTPALDIVKINALLIVCAVVGDAVGFQIGARAGINLYKREKSFFFRPQHLQRTKEFYEEHGGKTIIMARFVPIIRTFAPVVAGIAQMPYRRFAMFNIVGAVAWVISMTLLGFFLGKVINPKSVDKIALLIIFISVLPLVFEYLRHRRKKAASPAAESAEVAAAEASAKAASDSADSKS
ncbi:MAG: VTT domain-containing protein [Myxococcales bacterium]|nr:VTT domain-containing protein [Myxococcales bacterium]